MRFHAFEMALAEEYIGLTKLRLYNRLVQFLTAGGVMGTLINDDMYTAEVIADPYTYFGRLREEDPVHWNEKHELWVLTRHDDTVWGARHPELFSSETFKRDARDPYPPIDESDLGLYQDIGAFYTNWFLQHDPPRHTEERRIVHAYFTPKALEARRPMVRSVINDLLDEADQTGHMDVMRDFATPLPLFIIARMMGIPHEDRQFVRSMSQELNHIVRGGADRMQKIANGLDNIIEFLTPLVEERVAKPVDENDLLSVLASGEKTGILTRDEVLADAVLLIMAGHETTLNLICNGTLAFIQNPDQWELLKQGPFEDPDTVTRATEECLRYDPPISSIPRIATEDVEIRGKAIHKDDRLRWFLSGASRDPEKYIEPNKFDIGRWPNTHLTFGSGVHSCLGATLARMEGQEAFRALADRYDSISLEADDEVEYQPSILARSLKSLPVSLK